VKIFPREKMANQLNCYKNKSSSPISKGISKLEELESILIRQGAVHYLAYFLRNQVTLDP